MNDTKDKFTIGQCEICRKDTALKNGVCKDCKDKKAEIPDFLKGIVKDVNIFDDIL